MPISQSLELMEIDRLNRRVSKLESDLEKVIARYEIKISALEKKFKEIENAFKSTEDDYYSLKKDIISRINQLSPFLEDLKEIIAVKEALKEDINLIKRGLEKILIIIHSIHERVKTIEEVLHLEEK